MITATQNQILGQLLSKKTVREIKTALQVRSQSLVPNYLNILEKEGLIVKTRVANSFLYQINFQNPVVFNYLEIFNWDSLLKEPKKVMTEIVKKTTAPILLFGSYAKKTNTSKSDLDIAIISENKNLYKELEETELKSLLPLDIHILSEAELVEMMNSEQENLGKEIARNHMALTNSRYIYSLVKCQNRI